MSVLVYSVTHHTNGLARRRNNETNSLICGLSLFRSLLTG